MKTVYAMGAVIICALVLGACGMTPPDHVPHEVAVALVEKQTKGTTLFNYPLPNGDLLLAICKQDKSAELYSVTGSAGAPKVNLLQPLAVTCAEKKQ